MIFRSEVFETLGKFTAQHGLHINKQFTTAPTILPKTVRNRYLPDSWRFIFAYGILQDVSAKVIARDVIFRPKRKHVLHVTDEHDYPMLFENCIKTAPLQGLNSKAEEIDGMIGTLLCVPVVGKDTSVEVFDEVELPAGYCRVEDISVYSRDGNVRYIADIYLATKNYQDSMLGELSNEG